MRRRDNNVHLDSNLQRMLKKAAGSELKVELHKRMQFWRNKLILPDILVTSGSKKFIIDTKWKTISEKNPADNDLKQMFVYNEYFDTKESILLYPRTKQSQPAQAKYQTKQHGCRMEFVDLVKGGIVNKNIGREILNLIS